MAAHLEDIIEETGGCGRYQFILCFIVHACKLILVFGMIFMVIGAKVPDWWCADDFDAKNTSITSLTANISAYQSCTNHNGSSCRTFIFDESTASVVPEWNLVCDNAWITATIMSVNMAGVFVGNVVGGQVADLIGRKPPFYAAMATMTLAMIIAIFSTSWVMFAVMRFFIGISAGFHITVMYNIQTEFVLPRWRTWVVALPSWHIGAICFALISWGLDNWKHIHAVAAAIGVVSVMTCWFVQESFRWKVVHDHVEDAGKIIMFVAKINRTSVPSARALEEVAASVRESEKHDDRKYSLLDLFKSRTILKNSILLVIIWVTLGLGSCGIQFGIQSWSGSVYANMCIVAAINSPLQFALIYLQNRFGRKATNILFFAVFTIGSAAVGVLDQLEDSYVNRTASRVCAIVALVFINAVWSPVQTHTIELYPTVIRNIGYGLQNTMARVGAIIGPQLVLLDLLFPGTTYFVCAALGVLTCLVILPLPETRGKDLLDGLPGKHSSLEMMTYRNSYVNRTASRVCAIVALVFINAVWSPVQTHTIELYPTVIRNIGYGLQNTMARVGAIIGPQLVLLDLLFPGTTYFVCAALGVLTCLVILPLPETRGKDLLDGLPGKHSSLEMMTYRSS